MLHFTSDVFGIAKRAPAFPQPNRPNLSSPREYVLEQVAMDGSIVRNAQLPMRQLLVGALRRADRFKSLQSRLVSDAGNVPKDGRAGIAVRVCYGIVHGCLRAHRAVFARNRLAALIGGKTFAIEFAKILRHLGAQVNTFDGAYFRKCAAAYLEAFGSGFAWRGEGLGHGCIVADSGERGTCKTPPPHRLLFAKAFHAERPQ